MKKELAILNTPLENLQNQLKGFYSDTNNTKDNNEIFLNIHNTLKDFIDSVETKNTFTDVVIDGNYIIILDKQGQHPCFLLESEFKKLPNKTHPFTKEKNPLIFYVDKTNDHSSIISLYRNTIKQSEISPEDFVALFEFQVSDMTDPSMYPIRLMLLTDLCNRVIENNAAFSTDVAIPLTYQEGSIGNGSFKDTVETLFYKQSFKKPEHFVQFSLLKEAIIQANTNHIYTFLGRCIDFLSCTTID